MFLIYNLQWSILSNKLEFNNSLENILRNLTMLEERILEVWKDDSRSTSYLKLIYLMVKSNNKKFTKYLLGIVAVVFFSPFPHVNLLIISDFEH